MRFLVRSTLFAVAMAAGAGFSQTAPSAITPVRPMAADARPSFAVATIKPHDPNSRRQGIEADGDRFAIFDAPVSTLFAFAYSINRRQIIDAPGWFAEAHFDIEGRADAPGEPNLSQQQEMIRTLLADRFQLKFHHEKRLLPVYVIRLAKGGPKLAAAADANAKPEDHADGHGFETTRTYSSTSIGDFILFQQIFLDRPLVDETGLTGRYDFKLTYSYNQIQNTDPNASPGLFTAVQQQLGLKFEPTRALTDVYVIDHVEKASEN